MAGPGDIWNQAAEKWTEVSAHVTDDDWAKLTTCADWTVRDLVDHAMHWQAMGGGVLGAGTEPGQSWDVIQPALGAALQDPSNLEGMAEAFGNMPKQAVAGLVIGDLLIHSWDLARSIGADETLPAEAVEATLMGLGRLPDEMLRGDTMFGTPVEVGDDASAQDKLIAFAGRQP
jgi:uncharacterized protein (TIGR03086 family)